MERTCLNTELNISHVGEKVTLLGWVSKKRNFGSIVFIDLRDIYLRTRCRNLTDIIRRIIFHIVHGRQFVNVHSKH